MKNQNVKIYLMKHMKKLYNHYTIIPIVLLYYIKEDKNKVNIKENVNFKTKRNIYISKYIYIINLRKR